MPTIKNQRNYGIEILRFIAISLILSNHFIQNNTGVQGIGPDISSGVAIFIFISGFFNVKNTEWRTKRFAVTVLCGTILGLIIYGILFGCGFPVDNPLNFFFGKFICGKYNSGWFIYTYLAFTLLQPFINKFILKFNKWIVFGIITLFMLLSVSFSGFDPESNGVTIVFTFNKLFLFIGIYSFGAWFGLYLRNFVEHNKTPLKTIFFMSLFVLTFLLLGYRVQIYSYLDSHGIFTFYLYDLFNLFSAIASTLLFLSLPYIKFNFINKIMGGFGKISLSLYLMHAISGIVLDKYYGATPEIYNLGYYSLKFFIYYLLAIAFSVILYYIEKCLEWGCYKLASKIKTKKARVSP